MHRYHFNAYGPNRQVLDKKGEYLDDMMVLRDLAFATVRDMASTLFECGDFRRWRIEVEDEDGRTVLVVPFQSVRMVPVPHTAAGLSTNGR
jgi:hypothetical protein